MLLTRVAGALAGARWATLCTLTLASRLRKRRRRLVLHVQVVLTGCRRDASASELLSIVLLELRLTIIITNSSMAYDYYCY